MTTHSNSHPQPINSSPFYHTTHYGYCCPSSHPPHIKQSVGDPKRPDYSSYRVRGLKFPEGTLLWGLAIEPGTATLLVWVTKWVMQEGVYRHIHYVIRIVGNQTTPQRISGFGSDVVKLAISNTNDVYALDITKARLSNLPVQPASPVRYITVPRSNNLAINNEGEVLLVRDKEILIYNRYLTRVSRVFGNEVFERENVSRAISACVNSNGHTFVVCESEPRHRLTILVFDQEYQFLFRRNIHEYLPTQIMGISPIAIDAHNRVIVANANRLVLLESDLTLIREITLKTVEQIVYSIAVNPMDGIIYCSTNQPEILKIIPELS